MKLSTSKNSYISKIISYISHINWKHVALFLVFLIIAFAYWMSLFIEKDVKHKYILPVKYINIPEDVAFDTRLTDTFTINVESKGSNIINNTLFNRNPYIEIDVEQYQSERVTEIQGEELKRMFREKLELEPDQIKGYYPISIPLKMSKLQKKEVGVTFDGEITTAQNNLVVDAVEVIPHRITVYGTESQLSTITSVETEYTVIDGIKSSSEFQVKLKKNNDGIKYDREQITLNVPVLVYTERSIEVPINATNIPQGRDVKFFPSQVMVSFSVTLDDYKKISPEDFVINVNYNDFYNNDNARVEITLEDYPTSARNIKISPSVVEFLIEKR